MFRTSILVAVLCLIASQTSSAAGNPLGPIAHLMHKSTDSSYSEAYVLTMAPTKMAFDPKALLRGFNSVKNTLGRMSTFDSNEYPHLDNPLQLGFVRPPTLPVITRRVESSCLANSPYVTSLLLDNLRAKSLRMYSTELIHILLIAHGTTKFG